MTIMAQLLPNTLPPPEGLAALTLTQARAALRSGQISALDLTRACLARIGARDSEVRAWIALNPNALAQAALISPDDPRPLAGIPVAIKDMIDTQDLPTTANSTLHSTFRPASDAPVVQILRAAGAIVLGKTDTTEFAACGRNAATANPYDFTRTPGGSSSGSAAAVADYHVPFSIGTQTGGSTIRPASFNGIYALKPSWGLISTEGIRRYAVSFDTLSFFARSPEDLALLAEVFAFPTAPELVPGRLKLGLTLSPYSRHLEPETLEAFGTLSLRLAPVADVEEITLPQHFSELDELHRCVQHCEGASAFLHLVRSQPELLHQDFHDRVTYASGYTQRQHYEAYDRLAILRMECESLMQGYDAVIAPSALGYAPLGRGPGNPLFNALWTALQLPVANLPLRGMQLPLGASLIVKRGYDRQLPELLARLNAHR